MSEAMTSGLLEEFLAVTENLAAAIVAEDTGEMEKLIQTRAGIIEKLKASGVEQNGENNIVAEKIKKLDEKNSKAIKDLMAGYKNEMRRMKLSKKSVRLYSGTDLPPEAGFFDKKS